MAAEQTSGTAPQPNRWLILAVLSIGTFMSTLDGSIANVALPTISEQLHSPVNVVQWVLTAYLLTICATLPIVGKISDRYGRVRIYNWGFIVFALGSAMCALSATLPLLILSRVIQALGASCLMTNSQAIVAAIFPAGERGGAIGIVGTMVSVGSLSGPGLGGILVGHLGWSSIFWINLPIGIAGFLAGLKVFPKQQRRERAGSFDYVGSAAFMFGIVAFLATLSNAQEWGWGSPASLSGFGFAVVVLALFYWWESRHKDPMLDFRLYRNRTFAIGNIAALLSFIALFCTNVMLPFYMQDVLGYSAQLTGYTMMAYPCAMAVVAPISGWLSDRIGPNVLTTVGLSVNAVGFMLLSTLGLRESAWIIGLHMVLFGIGGGLFQSPNNSSIMGAVERHQLGTAGGLNALARNVGMVMGVAISVAIYTAVLSRLSGGNGHVGGGHGLDLNHALAALRAVYWTAAGVCVAALLVSSGRWMRNVLRRAG